MWTTSLRLSFVWCSVIIHSNDMRDVCIVCVGRDVVVCEGSAGDETHELGEALRLHAPPGYPRAIQSLEIVLDAQFVPLILDCFDHVVALTCTVNEASATALTALVAQKGATHVYFHETVEWTIALLRALALTWPTSCSRPISFGGCHEFDEVFGDVRVWVGRPEQSLLHSTALMMVPEWRQRDIVAVRMQWRDHEFLMPRARGVAARYIARGALNYIVVF